MSRPLRIEYPNALYHVTLRGNARDEIFHSGFRPGNFFEDFSGVVRRFNGLCHTYCLMDNHYHLLMEAPNGNLGKQGNVVNLSTSALPINLKPFPFKLFRRLKKNLQQFFLFLSIRNVA